ncbi:MAG: FG-GAP repeat protein [Planctomycetes bacterium]|nr:FG-GAP repeat protein [Planctomycetota bacterium]
MIASSSPRLLALLVLLLAASTAGAQCERDEFLPAPHAPHDLFGEAVAVSGETLVVGAPAGAPSGTGGGRVFVYKRVGGSWIQQALLTANDAQPDARFGASLALDGDVLVVGAPSDDALGPDAGAAYVFARFGSTWVQLNKLTGHDTAASDQFGYSVAVSGFAIAVGARRHDHPVPDAGAVYVFDNPSQGSIWSEVTELHPASVFPGDDFGAAVAIDGNRLLAGADLADHGGVSAGAAWIFHDDGSGWVEEAELVSPVPQAMAYFGRALDLSGDVAVVGAPGQLVEAFPLGPLVASGAVFGFSLDGGGAWVAEGALTHPEPVDGDGFGRAVALDGPIVLVGAPLSDDVLPNGGCVHAGWRDPAGPAWWLTSGVTARDGSSGDNLGFAVALDGAYAVGGARYHAGLGPETGSAYLYRGVSDLPVWSKLGQSLAGTMGEPCLFGEGTLVGGEAFVLSLNGALPFSVAGLVVGASELSLPFKGGTFVPNPDILVYGLPTFDGRLDVVATWPTGIPSGLDVYVQYWVLDAGAPLGFASTNAVVGHTP